MDPNSGFPDFVINRTASFLDLIDTDNFTGTNKAMRQLRRHVHEVHIFSPDQMSQRTVRRYPEIQNLNVLCFVHEDGQRLDGRRTTYRWRGDLRHQINADVVARFVPFVSKMECLKVVYLGVIDEDDDGRCQRVTLDWLEMENMEMKNIDIRAERSDRNNKMKESLDLAVSGAYSTGTISPLVQMHGVGSFCYKLDEAADDHGDSDRSDHYEVCENCCMIVKSRPLRCIGEMRQDRCFCLSPDAFVNTVLQRRGGRQGLANMLNLLPRRDRDYVSQMVELPVHVPVDKHSR